MPMRLRIPAISILLLLVPVLSLAEKTAAQADSLIARNLLIEDIRQLAAILEDTHPDPYLRGGGKIAFNRRLWSAIEAIPDRGMSREEFYLTVRPIIASVGDAHTQINDPHFSSGKYSPM